MGHTISVHIYLNDERTSVYDKNKEGIDNQVREYAKQLIDEKKAFEQQIPKE